MASEIFEIPMIGGPGTADIINGAERGKELFFSINIGNSVQSLHVSLMSAKATDKDVSEKDISNCKEWLLRGEFRIDRNVKLIEFEEIVWNSHFRKGTLNVSRNLVEQHSCEHLLYKNSKHCHVCGRQRVDD